jgi:hypothetical protein
VQDKFYLLLDVYAVGKFDASATKQQVNDEFMRRIMANQQVVCKECSGIYPAFSNMEQATTTATSRRRNLLMSDFLSKFSGPISILLVYDKVPEGMDSYNIYFSDVSRAVFAPSFTNIWSGSNDPASLNAFIEQMQNNQFVVTELISADQQNAAIKIDLSGSGVFIRTPAPTPAPTPVAAGGNSSNSTLPVPSPVEYAMDMTVFGVYDRSKIPQDGQYTSYKDKTSDASSTVVAARRKAFDPMFATIFLAASLLLFNE